MQLKLIFFFIFFPVILFGQKLNCCKTVEEVKQTLEGEWIRKDINSEIIYHFWFEGEQGGLEEMEKTDVEGEYLIVSCQPNGLGSGRTNDVSMPSARPAPRRKPPVPAMRIAASVWAGF